MWKKISIKFESTKGASNTRLRKTFKKCELDNVTRYSKDWIIRIEPLRREIQKPDIHIIDMEMTAHILLNLPEAYYNTVENLEDKLYDEIDPLTI